MMAEACAFNITHRKIMCKLAQWLSCHAEAELCQWRRLTARGVLFAQCCAMHSFAAASVVAIICACMPGCSIIEHSAAALRMMPAPRG